MTLTNTDSVALSEPAAAVYGAYEGSPVWGLLKPVIDYYNGEWGFAERDAETLLLAKTLADIGPVRGTWLDLGSGPTGPLWLPIVRPNHAVFADLHRSHLAVAAMRHDALRLGLPRWPVEQDALALAEDLVGSAAGNGWMVGSDCVEQDITHLHRFDNEPNRARFPAKLVTMIGCLGGLPHREALSSALWHAHNSLAPGGHLVIAMWLRDQPLVDLPPKFLSAPTLYSAAGISNCLSVDQLIEHVQVHSRVLNVSVLSVDQLAGGTLENNTSRMVVLTAKHPIQYG